jgi:hypothetical protein
MIVVVFVDQNSVFDSPISPAIDTSGKFSAGAVVSGGKVAAAGVTSDQCKSWGRWTAKYGIRSPKFIWAPCAQLYSLAETPQPPPRIWAPIRGRYWSAKIEDISL